MVERYKDRPALVWQRMNATALEYPDETFDVALDKGTLDSVLCGEGSAANVAKMCMEVRACTATTSNCTLLCNPVVDDIKKVLLQDCAAEDCHTKLSILCVSLDMNILSAAHQLLVKHQLCCTCTLQADPSERTLSAETIAFLLTETASSNHSEERYQTRDTNSASSLLQLWARAVESTLSSPMECQTHGCSTCKWMTTAGQSLH
jgi:hypothetical protein